MATYLATQEIADPVDSVPADLTKSFATATISPVSHTVTPPPLRTLPPLELEEHPIDEVGPIKVIVVGAGIAGITAAILLPRKVPNLELQVLERHSDLVRTSNQHFHSRSSR